MTVDLHSSPALEARLDAWRERTAAHLASGTCGRRPGLCGPCGQLARDLASIREAAR